jgi:hypothetical protein
MKKRDLAKLSFTDPDKFHELTNGMLMEPNLSVAWEHGLMNYLSQAEQKKFHRAYDLASYWHEKYMEIQSEIEKLEGMYGESAATAMRRRRRRRN